MKLEILPVQGLPEIQAGDDLATLISDAMSLRSGDVLVVAQKAISKAEGRLVSLRDVRPGPHASQLAATLETDPRLVEVILGESRRVVRADRVLIVETHQGFVCANAGVDRSNVPGEDQVCLLPVDPDASAARLRERLRDVIGVEVAVVVSDSFGRPWRLGLTNVALGVSGLPAVLDLRGATDDLGHLLQATVIAVADELAAAAELVMGKTRRVPAALVRGWIWEGPVGSGRDLVRPADLDLFR